MMKNKKTVPIRLVDELGRIVIPKEVRSIMAWPSGSAVEIWVNEAGKEVILKTHTYACTYCGATEDLKEFNKRHICPACQSAISKL